MNWYVREMRPCAYDRGRFRHLGSIRSIQALTLIVLAPSIFMNLVACGQGAVDCSAREVKETVLSLFRQRLESNPYILALYLVEKSDTKITNVRTVQQSARGVRCLADLETYFVARPEVIQAKLRESGTAINSVEYSVQLTDENKPYVTLN